MGGSCGSKSAVSKARKLTLPAIFCRTKNRKLRCERPVLKRSRQMTAFTRCDSKAVAQAVVGPVDIRRTWCVRSSFRRPTLRTTAPVPPQNPRALAGRFAGSRHPPVDHTKREEVAHHHRWLRRRGLLPTESLIHDGPEELEQRQASESGPRVFCDGDNPTIADERLSCIVGAVTRVLKTKVPDIPTVQRVMAVCEEVMPCPGRIEPAVRRSGDLNP